MSIKMIICTSSEQDGYAIGKDNKLLWHIPEDMRYFRETTKGATVIMGRKTFDSINSILDTDKGLPNRKNIVLSRTVEGGGSVDIVSIDILLKTLNSLDNNNDVFVIGGKEVYTQLLSYIDKVYHTTVEGSYPDADTHFNMDFLKTGDWKIVDEKVLCDKATVKVWERV